MVYKLAVKNKLQNLKSKPKNLKHNIYNDIPFDAIKRGSLLVLVIGLSFTCLSFGIEIYVFLWLTKTNK